MVGLVDAAYALHRFLVARDWSYCFIGGLALQHWGEPRLTLDIDLTVLAGFGDEARYVDALLQAYEARIVDAREFALKRRVLLLRSRDGVDIDLSLGALPFEKAAVARASAIELLPGKPVRLCSAEDLVVFKAFADRPRDWIDIDSVIARQGVTALDWALIDSQLSELAALKEQPELVEKLHRLRAGAARD
jgi:hypothetical protein